MPQRPYYSHGHSHRVRNTFNAAATRETVFEDLRRAIAQKDAEALASALRDADARRVAFNRETVWRLTGAEDDPALLSALWSVDEKRRDIHRLVLSAWQGAVNAGAVTARLWLSDPSRPSLTVEDKAGLAGLALRRGDVDDAMRFMAAVEDLPAHMQDSKNKLLVDFLHSAAANGASTAAVDILRSHFGAGQTTFSPQNGVYQSIVMRAATAGHSGTLAALLAAGEAYLCDHQLDQLLIAVCDRHEPSAAALLVQSGAVPLAYDGAAMRHAARHLAATLVTGDPDVINGAWGLLDVLLRAGGVPAIAKASLAQAGVPGDVLTAVDARAAAAAERQYLFIRQNVPIDACREPQSHNGRYESAIHRAARHRVLARLIADGVWPAPTLDDWHATNPAGQSVISLCVQSGEVENLMSPTVWDNRPHDLRAFLAALPDDIGDGHGRLSLLQHIEQMTDEARAHRKRFRL